MINYIKQSDIKPLEEEDAVKTQVFDILRQIKDKGDAALISLSKQYDGFMGESILVTPKEIEKAYDAAGEAVVNSLKTAAGNIRKFALEQKKMFANLDVNTAPGVILGHSVIPLESCGCYVPGGRYPLPSSALMSIIPSKVAGVKRVAAVSPVSKEYGGIHPSVIAAMDIAGADEIYCVGGAQAIGALAYGTESIKSVCFIAGPGNQYVTEAKRQVYGTVGIDFLAGPSEVMIIADSSANADYIAADILAQSEHDPQSSGILVTTSEEMAKKVIERVEHYMENLKTREIAEAAWRNNGQVILCGTIEEAAQIANEAAPEHLEIQVREPEVLKEMLSNYGSLFIGQYAAEVFGDYSSGTNHILPTVKAAKYTGGVWVGTFLKVVTYQKVTKEGAKQVGTAASHLAGIEGLMAHKLAADLRL